MSNHKDEMKRINEADLIQSAQYVTSSEPHPEWTFHKQTTLSLCLVTLLVCCWFSSRAAEGELKSETTVSYQKYVSELEPRLERQNHSEKDFLWIDQDQARLQTVRSGNIALQHKNSLVVPGGMIQHWIGGVFIPGATIESVKQVDQDYADYAKMYSPEISRPKVLLHDGNHYVVSYRITKKKVLTAVEDTVHVIDYIPLGPNRLSVRSRSQSVNQVEDAGTPSEHILPTGEGTGFLWAMDSYWRMEERDGGVYVECEAITLSRDVPFGMGAMINPILQSFAEESLKKTLEAKRSAVKSTQ